MCRNLQLDGDGVRNAAESSLYIDNFCNRPTHPAPLSARGATSFSTKTMAPSLQHLCLGLMSALLPQDSRAWSFSLGVLPRHAARTWSRGSSSSIMMAKDGDLVRVSLPKPLGIQLEEIKAGSPGVRVAGVVEGGTAKENGVSASVLQEYPLVCFADWTFSCSHVSPRPQWEEGLPTVSVRLQVHVWLGMKVLNGRMLLLGLCGRSCLLGTPCFVETNVYGKYHPPPFRQIRQQVCC